MSDRRRWDPLPSDDEHLRRPELARLSKRIFNARHRLAFALHVLEAYPDAVFQAYDVVAALGLSSSVVHKELQVHIELGCLTRLSGFGSGVYYERMPDDPYWTWIAHLGRTVS